MALNGLAQAMLMEWGSTWYAGSSEQHLEALDRVVNKAMAINPDDALATTCVGYMLETVAERPESSLSRF